MPIPTAAELAEFDRYAREIALLKLAVPHMSRLDVEDLNALCELTIERNGPTLAEIVYHPALPLLREMPGDADLALMLLARATVTIRGKL